MEPISLTVRQLNLYVRSLLEGDAHLSSLTLEGELSNFKNHYSSGHWYFVLKDSDAAIRCVMFKGNACRVSFVPRDGMRVICRGYVSLYEKDGQFQFYAESMRQFGEGDLAAEFERIKQKLEAEGLFAAELKHPLPSYPKKIGLITSDTGAALQDMLQIFARRYPMGDLVLFPALVQGSAAPASLIAALQRAYKRTDLDLLIIGRGGGSAEDLSCFNDEKLARVVSSSPVPIISAVGHEIDFTICDFVSDLRAPTPSAAAELATPDIRDLMNRLDLLFARMKSAFNRHILQLEQRFDQILDRRPFTHPELLFSPYEVRLETLIDKINTSYLLKIKQYDSEYKHLLGGLEALSPKCVLERGYTLTTLNGKIANSIHSINENDVINVRFLDGVAVCTVNEKHR